MLDVQIAARHLHGYGAGIASESAFDVSAMQQLYLAEVPCVLWSKTWGRMPRAFMMISRRARPTVALGRSPGLNILS